MFTVQLLQHEEVVKLKKSAGIFSFLAVVKIKKDGGIFSFPSVANSGQKSVNDYHIKFNQYITGLTNATKTTTVKF